MSQGLDEARLVAISRDALLLTDRSGKILFANPAATELLNSAPSTLRTRLLVSHVELAHRRQFRAYLNRAARGEAVGFDLELAPRGLQPFPVRAKVALLGKHLGWVLRETAASSAETPVVAGPVESVRLGRILESIRDGVVVLDRDRCVLFANRAARAMFAPHTLEVGDAVPDPSSASVRRLVDELFEHDALNAEAIIEPDSHTAYWLRAYQSGDGDTAVLLLSDITEEERRERAERDFIAHAAHELQSPLTGISGAIEVLLAGAHVEEESRLRFLGHIERENERLTRLLRSLLLLAQAQATDERVKVETFELRPLLEEVAAAAEPGRVDVVCPPSLVARGHRDLVEHALSNLVVNAIRHGGLGRVIVKARRTAGGTVKVEVVDVGPGIPEEERERVFERFYRGGPRTDQGFGLGLSIARQAAHAVDGELELRSNPRGGTIAELTLRGGP